MISNWDYMKYYHKVAKYRQFTSTVGAFFDRLDFDEEYRKYVDIYITSCWSESQKQEHLENSKEFH